MKEFNKYFTKLLILSTFILLTSLSVRAQVNNGNGSLIAGDYWNSYLCPNNLSHTGASAAAGASNIIFGSSIDKTWSNAKGQYPNAFPYTTFWTPHLLIFVYDQDSTVCPKTINGVTNPACVANSIVPGTLYSNYYTANYKKTLQGATDAARTYQNPVKWVDGDRRQHQIYEAGWVTNAGIDVKFRAHQFAAPNWNNFNDFQIIEISLKNTGNVDINFDGVYEKTNHKITGLSMSYYDGNYSPSTCTDYNGLGTRYSVWGPTPARTCGYNGELDANGAPWNFGFDFASCSNPLNEAQANPLRLPAGEKDMGVPIWDKMFYTDIWPGFTWVAAKKGGLPVDPTQSTTNSQDKTLMWGTPAIGSGPQRGWFNAYGRDYGAWAGVYASANPRASFKDIISQYFKVGAKIGSNESDQDPSPAPNFFKGGEKEKFETWVPIKTSGFTDVDRPSGDYKYKSLDLSDPASAFYQITETGLEDIGKPYPNSPNGKPAWGYMGSRGFVDYQSFDFAIWSAVGPFGLDVNEEVTLTFLVGAGFRLEGLQKAIRAGRYAFESNYQIPQTPPLPTMHIKSSGNMSFLVKWDNKAENDSKFAGYKIWRSSQFSRYKFLTDGMRLIDKYQEQMTPGEDKAKYRRPINPNFDAFTKIERSAYRGEYPGSYWGTWELVSNIPKSELSKFIDPAPLTDTKYSYDDKTVRVGGSYWYYVSAYSEGTFKGPDGETTTRIETHSTNRNGSSGFWEGTFPYAVNNPNYPKDEAGMERMGKVINLYTPVVSTGQLAGGQKKIGVRPNPYKRAALQDNFLKTYDHKLLFYNLPAKCKITIVDVAGQIVQVLDFESTDPNGGSLFWNMFSKDGQEVASGLYIYYVEYDGGTHTGKFSILR